MATVATLTVRLSANSAQLVREFGRTQRRARTFGQRMRGSLAIVGRAFASVSGAGIVALTGLSAAGVKAGDQLAKTAQKLGIAADKLAGLRFAAEQTGASVRTLDLGLQRMIRRVSEAAKGTGEAQKALKELGLDAKELTRLAPDEQFRRIADAFKDLGSQTEKVRLGFKLFDSEGVALVNTLAAGRKELDRFTEEAQRFGLALSGQKLVRIQEAADAQNRVAKSFSGLGRQLAATFAPAMAKVADSTAELVSRLTVSVSRMTTLAALSKDILRDVDNLSGAQVRAELDEVAIAIEEAAKRQAKALDELRTGGNGRKPGRFSQREYEDATAVIDKLNKRHDDLQLRLGRIHLAQLELNKSTTAWLGISGTQIQRNQKLSSRWNEVRESLLGYIEAQNRLESSGQSIFQQTRTDLEIYLQKLGEAKKALEAGLLPGGQNTFERYKQQLNNDLIPALEEAKKKGNELNLTFSSAFEDAIVEGKRFQDVLQGIYQDLLRILVRRSITEPLGNAFGSLIGGFLGGGGAGAAAVGGATGAGVAKSAASVVNNYSFQAGADVATIKTEIIPMLELTQRAAVAEVFDQKRRGNL